jgi:hypothetical protein
MAPDPSRRRNKYSNAVSNACQTTGSTIYQEVPVNVNFSLFIYTRHIDDTLQIVEQIIPYFNPEHFIKLDMNPAQTAVNIPIVMTGNSISERYDGDLSTRRINISTINFTAKSYIFGEVLSATTINAVGVTAGLTGFGF